MKPTVRERIYAGAIVTVALWVLLGILGAMFDNESPVWRVAPMFLYSFVGLILLVAHRPRPFLDWVRKWTGGWPRLP